MSESESEKKLWRQRMPYILEFSRFFVGFVIVIGVALIILHTVSVAAATVAHASSTSTAQSSGK